MNFIPWKTTGVIPVRHSKNSKSANDFQLEVNGLMNNLFNRSELDSTLMFDTSFYHSLDVKENDDKYLIDADVPGVMDDDLDLGIQDNILTIKGERKSDSDKKDFGYVCTERNVGFFRRDISFDEEVDQDKIMAHLKNGVLHIELVKKEKNMENRRKIQIKN